MKLKQLFIFYMSCIVGGAVPECMAIRVVLQAGEMKSSWLVLHIEKQALTMYTSVGHTSCLALHSLPLIWERFDHIKKVTRTVLQEAF